MKVQKDGGDTSNIIDEWGKMNIEGDRIAKDWLWHQIHYRETHQTHEAVYGTIEPKTMEYHNGPYTITSHFSKTIKIIISKHQSLK